MKENVDKDLCDKLELSFKEGFNNRNEFYMKLEELNNLQSVSLQNLAAFENFGAADLEKLQPICQHATSLNIDFAGMLRNQNEASGLEKFLREDHSLKALHLSFKESKFVSEQDLFWLCNFLTNSFNLSSVTLNLEKCEETTNPVTQKLIQLAGNFPEFSLNLLHCPHLTQETLKILTKCFWGDDYDFNYFKGLTLKLGHSQHFSNSWLQSFSSYLRQIRITRLSLHFEGCPEIEYQGVNHLISAISQIGALKELNLTFIDCKKLSGVRIFKNLGQCLKELKNLKVFMLCIKECPNFHFDDLEKFRKRVQNVPVVELECIVTKKNEVSDFEVFGI